MPDKELKNIIEDNTSGSSELIEKLNKYVKKISDDRNKLKETIKLSKEKLSSFQSINNYISKLERKVKDYNEKEILEFAEKFEQEKEIVYLNIYRNCKKYFKEKNKILTLSNSQTLQEIIKLWHKDNKQVKVVILESRPKNEGRILAKKLLSENIKVEFITDAMISLFIPKVDAVLIGADKILKNGNVVNKSGSLSAALLCSYYEKPFYVITSKDKISNETNFKPDKKEPSEIWKYKHDKLNISNIYFEEIPNKLINRIITD